MSEIKQAQPWLARRYCAGDESFTDWRPITQAEFDARKDDSTFEFRVACSSSTPAEVAPAVKTPLSGDANDFAIKFIETRAEEYARENSSSDPEDGSTIWHYGDTGRDYHNTLVELAEDIRLALAAEMLTQAADCEHKRKTTTALGAVTNTGWKCADCGKLMSAAEAPDRMYGDATPSELETAELAVKAYGFSDSDVPAFVKWERYRVRESLVPGMPGLSPIPSFIAGFNAGRAMSVDLRFSSERPINRLRQNDPDFAAHLDQISAVVATWPKWKQGLWASETEPSAPALTVWTGSLPESNGKRNFTAILKRKGASAFDTDSYTFARSEYPDRVRYDADCRRYLIGELEKEPCILDYDADLHSDYKAPQDPTERNAARYQLLRNVDFSKTGPMRGVPWVIYLDPKQQMPRTVICQGQELDAVIDAVLATQETNPVTADPNTSQTTPPVCSCPSGDGSLRWPCIVHPPKEAP